jgi:folate-binding Fe-S cluster repair protein YgfZ
VLHDGRAVGVLGSVVQHADLGPVALALLRRGTPEDAVLTVGDAAAAQEVPPLLAAGPHGGAGRAAQQGLRVPR